MESGGRAHGGGHRAVSGTLGRSRQALEDGVHLFDEVAAEAGALRLVPVARFVQIRLGFRAENDTHDLRRFLGVDALKRDFTSVQGRTVSPSAA